MHQNRFRPELRLTRNPLLRPTHYPRSSSWNSVEIRLRGRRKGKGKGKKKKKGEVLEDNYFVTVCSPNGGERSTPMPSSSGNDPKFE